MGSLTNHKHHPIFLESEFLNVLEPLAHWKYQINLKEKDWSKTLSERRKRVVKSQRALAGHLFFFSYIRTPKFQVFNSPRFENGFKRHYRQVQHGRSIHKTHSLYKNSQAYLFTSQSSNTLEGQILYA